MDPTSLRRLYGTILVRALEDRLLEARDHARLTEVYGVILDELESFERDSRIWSAHNMPAPGLAEGHGLRQALAGPRAVAR